ncbi:MAG: ABC transporter permease [Trueperaceae bacterium]
MRAALLVAANDLRQRFRDRSLFIFGIIVPFGLAFVFSLLLGPFTNEGPVDVRLGFVDEDVSLVSAGMRTALSAASDAGALSWESVDTVAHARERVEAGEIGAVIVVPEGFGGPVAAGGRSAASASEAGAGAGAAGQDGGAGGATVPAAPQITVIGSPDSAFSTLVAESVASSYASRLRSAVWTNAALAEAGQAAIPAVVFAQVASTPDALSLRATPTSSRQLDFTTYYAVGMAALFVFFTVQLGVTGLLDEERDGTLTRLLAAPTGRWSILAGKVLSSMTIGVASMVIMALASTWLMGANWGDPLGVLVLIVALVAAAAGILMLVAGLARSVEAAGNLQAIVAILLGSLGGAFFQIPQQEGVLQWLQRASPHYWFLQGMGDLAGGGGLGVLGNELLAIAAFAVVAGTVGWFAMGRRLNR